jgi:hypothetical protein
MSSPAATLLQAYYATLNSSDKVWKAAFNATFHKDLVQKLPANYGGEEITRADFEERTDALRAVGVKATGFQVLAETEEPETVSYRVLLHITGYPDPIPTTDLAQIKDGKAIRIDPIED